MNLLFFLIISLFLLFKINSFYYFQLFSFYYSIYNLYLTYKYSSFNSKFSFNMHSHYICNFIFVCMILFSEIMPKRKSLWYYSFIKNKKSMFISLLQQFLSYWPYYNHINNIKIFLKSEININEFISIQVFNSNKY